MRKWLGGLVVLILLIGIVPYFIDVQSYKAPLEKVLKDKTGLEVNFKGALSFRMIPSLGIHAKDVAIKNTPQGKAENLVTAKSVSLKVSWPSLLRGKVIIEDVVLQKPEVYLETLKTGESNWQRIQEASSASESQPTAQKSPEKSSEKTEGINFALQKISLQEGKVSIRNLKTHSQQDIEHVNIEGSLDFPRVNLKGQGVMGDYTLHADIQSGQLFNSLKTPLKAKLTLLKGKENYGDVNVHGTLENAKFKGDIESPKITYGNYALHEIKGILWLHQGGLELKDFQAKGYEGFLHGNCRVMAGEKPEMHLKLQVEGVNVAALPHVQNTALKRAFMEASLDCSASVKSMHDLVHSLSGVVHVNLKDVLVETLNPQKFLQVFESIKNVVEIPQVISSFNQKSKVPFAYIKTDLMIKGGQATISHLEGVSDDLILTGSGNINLPRWVLDMLMRIKLKNAKKALEVDVNIKGDLSDPSFAVDKGALTKALLSKTAGGLVDTVIHPVDSVGGILKGSVEGVGGILKGLLQK